MSPRRRVAVSQRVEVFLDRGERRDALDQAWTRLLHDAGFLPLPLPNRPDMVDELFEAWRWDAVVLTGGNDLSVYGGDAPERDATEARLVALARRHGLPVLGVCRGMQMLAHLLGGRLHPVEGHVAVRHAIETPQGPRMVNSYHAWGVLEAPPGTRATARSVDGVVEAMAHDTEALTGIMWHPERESPADAEDLAFLADVLGHRPPKEPRAS